MKLGKRPERKNIYWILSVCLFIFFLIPILNLDGSQRSIENAATGVSFLFLSFVFFLVFVVSEVNYHKKLSIYIKEVNRRKFNNIDNDLGPSGEKGNLGDQELLGNEKKCPFCAEIIKAEAIKCKHCGEFLNKPNS